MASSLFDEVIANTQTSLANTQAATIQNNAQPERFPTPAPVVADEKVLKNYAGQKSEFFTVDKTSIAGPYGDIPGKRALFVGDKCINIVSDKYEIHQPNEIYQTFADVAEKTSLEINRVLTNPHNGGLMISAKFAGTKVVGENHDINLTFYTSHCGKYKTFLTLDLLRIACLNQVPCLYNNKNRFIFAEKHYKNALDIQLMEKALENIPASVEAYNEKAKQLMHKKLTFNDFVEYYVEHYKMDKEAKQFDTKVEKLRAVYYNATGQREIAPDTAYKAYQAITFSNTHELRKTPMQAENILTKNSQDSIIVLEELLAAA